MTIQVHNGYSRNGGLRDAGLRRFLPALFLVLTLLPAVASALPIDGPGDPGGPGGPGDFDCFDASDCDDGLACTVGERCVRTAKFSRCVAGREKSCDDGDPCTADTCSEPTGACRHQLIGGPSCAPPTTIIITTTTITTTTIAEATTTTTTQPGGSTTTTTLPPTDETCVPGSADCDDGDACTQDTCDTGGGCVATPVTGIAAVTCVCDQTVPPACGAALPPKIEKVVARGCRGATLAADEDGVRRRRLLRVAQRAFALAARRTALLARKELVSSECAVSLGGLLADAKLRAQVARAAE
jgi:hypothetical protein